jgi:hypothetical protein
MLKKQNVPHDVKGNVDNSKPDKKIKKMITGSKHLFLITISFRMIQFPFVNSFLVEFVVRNTVRNDDTHC